MDYLFLFFLLSYSIILFWFYRGISLLPKKLSSTVIPELTIIIPVKNEELYLSDCLESLYHVNHREKIKSIIIIDDFSTDNTSTIISEWSKKWSIVSNFKVPDQYLHISSPKKRALTAVLPMIQTDWIALTDGDCLLPKNWLFTMSSFIHPKTHMVGGPVEFTIPDRSLFFRWLHTEFSGLMIVSAGSIGQKKPSTANAANLWFKKSIFYTVNGYDGNEQISSGDDEFLMHKFHRHYPGCITYSWDKEATVLTPPPISLNHFIHQRIRWASKGRHYHSKTYITFLLFIYLIHLSFLCLPFFAVYNHAYILSALIIFYKMIVDSIFLKKSNEYLLQKVSPYSGFIFQIIQIPYVLIAGFLGTFSGYQWKGIRYKK